jgi:GAF domain-containing protein
MTDRDQRATAGREASIIDAFVRLSDTLVDDFDIIEFLHFLTQCCIDLVPVDEAAVMLAAPSGTMQAVASSSERSRLLELFELQNRDGPCLDAYQSGAVVLSPDLSMERERWPTFATRALDDGFHAVHSVPLRLRNEIIGALNLLRGHTGTLSDSDAKLVQSLSDIATIGVLQERLVSRSASMATGLQVALTSRIRIEQAKGIMSERSGISIDAAFDLLRAYARRNSRRLSDVASDVVERNLDVASELPPET